MDDSNEHIKSPTTIFIGQLSYDFRRHGI